MSSKQESETISRPGRMSVIEEVPLIIYRQLSPPNKLVLLDEVDFVWEQILY